MFRVPTWPPTRSSGLLKRASVPTGNFHVCCFPAMETSAPIGVHGAGKLPPFGEDDPGHSSVPPRGVCQLPSIHLTATANFSGFNSRKCNPKFSIIFSINKMDFNIIYLSHSYQVFIRIRVYYIHKFVQFVNLNPQQNLAILSPVTQQKICLHNPGSIWVLEI